MRRLAISTQSLGALHTLTHTSDFIKTKNEYIEKKKDRLCAKVIEKRLQNSLSFLCSFKIISTKDKYV